MRLKIVSFLVALTVGAGVPSASFAGGAGDEQYIDPFATTKTSSLAKKCKKKKYKKTKKCKQYRKTHKS